MIQEGMRWLSFRPALDLPAYATKNTLAALIINIRDCCAKGENATLHAPSTQDQFPTGVQVVVLLDYSNFEMSACALILGRLLPPLVVARTELIPYILPKEEAIPETIEI